MLGQPVFLQPPEVIGFHLSGSLQKGVTATDLTLRITEILRKEKVVGKFVEFFGEGAASLLSLIVRQSEICLLNTEPQWDFSQ